MHFNKLAWMLTSHLLTSHLESTSNTKARSGGPHVACYWQLQSGTENPNRVFQHVPVHTSHLVFLLYRLFTHAFPPET